MTARLVVLEASKVAEAEAHTREMQNLAAQADQFLSSKLREQEERLRAQEDRLGAAGIGAGGRSAGRPRFQPQWNIPSFDGTTDVYKWIKKVQLIGKQFSV